MADIIIVFVNRIQVILKRYGSQDMPIVSYLLLVEFSFLCNIGNTTSHIARKWKYVISESLICISQIKYRIGELVSYLLLYCLETFH